MMDFEKILAQNNLEQMELFEQGRGKALDKMIQKEKVIRSDVRMPESLNNRLMVICKTLGISKNEGLVRLTASGVDEIEADPRYQQMKKEMEEQ